MCKKKRNTKLKYYFKSDYFTYVHPENRPRGVSEFTSKDLEEAKKNTDKFHINRELFETALYESDGAMNEKQLGTIILFPEVPKSDICLMEAFIKDVFAKAESELGDEYNEADDPTIFWETGSGGKHFDGKAVNYKTKETFGINSPSIYIAGCKDTTADYLIETSIDMMYNESKKYDRKSIKNGGDTIRFGRFRTFLVYNVGSRRFYEFGSHENDLYQKINRTVNKPDCIVYEAFIPTKI